jgi:uncharacterized protein
MKEVILSHFQAQELLDARKQGLQQIPVSLDLGRTCREVRLDEGAVYLKDDLMIGWERVVAMAESPSSCFVIEAEGYRTIQFYSEETERVYSLYPTVGAPSMLVSGIPMHRIKDTDPNKDTMEKIRVIKPMVGQVLDTATGLGYTAILAARTAEHVTTIELDPAVLEVCKLNPWSQELFDNPKITQMVGDSFDIVMGMEAGSFTRVVHDPPVISLAGDLYSSDFYRELYRVMRNHSRLFHYVGDPESKSGKNITGGVTRRLEQVGFRLVRRVPGAFGVVAEK